LEKQFQRFASFFCRDDLLAGFLYIYSSLTEGFMRTFLMLCLLLPGLLPAQPIVPLTGENFPGANVGVAATYDPESVMQYNNGADLILELGFQSLTVQEISWETENIKIEVYAMQDPEAAFGILSLSASKCLHRDTLFAHNCMTRYQFQSAWGKLYISITSETGSEKAIAMYLPVAQAVMQLNQQQPLVLPAPFEATAMKTWHKNLVYINGPVGFQNSLLPWQDLFLGVRFGMYAIFLANPDREIYFAQVRFETPADQARFLEQAGLMTAGFPVPNTNTNDGLYREYSQVNDQTIYFLQAQEPWPISALVNP
jgi:hypothetical protein